MADSGVIVFTRKLWKCTEDGNFDLLDFSTYGFDPPELGGCAMWNHHLVRFYKHSDPISVVEKIGKYAGTDFEPDASDDKCTQLVHAIPISSTFQWQDEGEGCDSSIYEGMEAAAQWVEWGGGNLCDCLANASIDFDIQEQGELPVFAYGCAPCLTPRVECVGDEYEMQLASSVGTGYNAGLTGECSSSTASVSNSSIQAWDHVPWTGSCCPDDGDDADCDPKIVAPDSPDYDDSYDGGTTPGEETAGMLVMYKTLDGCADGEPDWMPGFAFWESNLDQTTLDNYYDDSLVGTWAADGTLSAGCTKLEGFESIPTCEFISIPGPNGPELENVNSTWWKVNERVVYRGLDAWRARYWKYVYDGAFAENLSQAKADILAGTTPIASFWGDRLTYIQEKMSGNSDTVFSSDVALPEFGRNGCQCPAYSTCCEADDPYWLHLEYEAASCPCDADDNPDWLGLDQFIYIDGESPNGVSMSAWLDMDDTWYSADCGTATGCHTSWSDAASDTGLNCYRVKSATVFPDPGDPEWWTQRDLAWLDGLGFAQTTPDMAACCENNTLTVYEYEMVVFGTDTCTNKDNDGETEEILTYTPLFVQTKYSERSDLATVQPTATEEPTFWYDADNCARYIIGPANGPMQKCYDPATGVLNLDETKENWVDGIDGDASAWTSIEPAFSEFDTSKCCVEQHQCVDGICTAQEIGEYGLDPCKEEDVNLICQAQSQDETGSTNDPHVKTFFGAKYDM